MSAPTPAPGDDRPREGYYPDPSIPGYVRYWNGASWVPGTSRPAPKDGEPLTPPPGVRPAAPAVEETGPHFFDEDPQPRSAPGGAGGRHTDPRVLADGPAQPAGHAARTDGTASIPPADDDAPDPGGTFIFRRPVPGPAAVHDDGAAAFPPVPGQGRGGQDGPTGTGQGPQGAGFGGQGAGPGASGTGFGAPGPGRAGQGGGFGGQGPAGAPAPSPASSAPASSPVSPASGPGFGAGKAAASRAAAQAPQAAAQPVQGALGHPAPAAQQPPAAPAAVSPSVPQQAGPAQPAATPLTAGAGGGQSSWAQQVHRLAGGGDDQPVAPWKPPVDDVFQAAARRQAAARPAGLGKRFAARLVDSLVVGAVTAAAAVPLGTRAADHIQQKIDAARLSGRTVTVWLVDGTTGTSLGIVLAVLLVSGVLFEVLPTARWGRTLGKKLCGLEVRDIEAHEPPTFGRALLRWLVYSVPGLLGIGVLGVLWCLFDRPWRQCWHDKAAHTFVAD
ncbi:RDD family protein [Streptomyces sp. PanSC9]|uniref:RDD family protein n=1 Tax=Streptomyces sp. PanSC9 TaxID=1520461 RepID=UPI000F4A0E06|nr:RDD family protein [Streptomyces sp. PanSC9]ROP52902.1 putative RDD family membrane protein YckC [Streptomyces sp. PanSC9]